jgi:hypothetical protein
VFRPMHLLLVLLVNQDSAEPVSDSIDPLPGVGSGLADS